MDKLQLQLALDNRDLQSALSVIQQTHAFVDIIEVGTVLCLAEGMHAVRTMRSLFPHKLIVADVRIIKAGGLIAEVCFAAGADRVSIMSDASTETIAAVIKQAERFAGDVQIELNGNWHLDQAKHWFDLGIRQVISHRTDEAGSASASWKPEDFTMIAALAEMGFQVTVTGGITLADVPLLKEQPVAVIIAGRAIRDAEDPAAAARLFREAIDQ